MQIEYGGGKTKFGPGVLVKITGDELAVAVHAWLVAHGIHIDGPRTVSVNGGLCQGAEVYVDPSGAVYDQQEGAMFSGRGPT